MSRMMIAAGLALAAIFVFTPRAAWSQSTEFNYQGNLTNGGTLANGSFDFEFLLFDALSSGTQQGSTLARNGVVVSNGAFSVSLDFGDQFPGADRFLEIRVRPAGGGGFTPLSPRQKLASTPYSVKSITANNALNLGGIPASQYATSATGSSGFIQNTTTEQPASNFNISGNGIAAGLIRGDVVSAVTQFNISSARILGNAGLGNLFAGNGSGIANTGTLNAFFGSQSGFNNQAGSGNTFIGRSAGTNSLTGGSNTFLGLDAGLANTTGNSNTILGATANLGGPGLINASAFGSRARVDCSNCLVLGSINGIQGANADTNVGIGTNSPTSRLHVVGNGLFTGNLSVNGTLNATLPAGSGNYIQSQSKSTQTAEFDISGTGKASTFEAATQFRLGGQHLMSTPGGNLFIGPSAGSQTTSGSFNTFVGISAGQSNVAGFQNSFFGTFAGMNNTGSSNSYFGHSAGFFSTGTGNSAFGDLAFTNSVVGNDNSVFGRGAGNNSTGMSQNSFFGASSGLFNTSGSNNAFFGYDTGKTNRTGGHISLFGKGADVASNNLTYATAIGADAVVASSNTIALGRANGSDAVLVPGNLTVNGALNATLPTGSANYIQNQNAGPQAASNFNISGNGTAGGTLTGNVVNALTQFNINGNRVLSVEGSSNTILGDSAGSSNSGGFNSFFGKFAGQNNTTGNRNSFFGAEAGRNNTTGSANQFLGNNAGNTNTTGGNNTVIGDNADVSTGNLTNATAIGALARVDLSNSLVLGSINGVNGATASTNVGIGTTAPARLLHISNGASGATSLSTSDFVIEDDASAFQHFLTPDDSESGILFGDPSASIGGGFIFNNAATNNGIQFRSGGNTTRMTLDGSGNFGIGTTSPLARLDVRGDVLVGLTSAATVTGANSVFVANDGGDQANTHRIDGVNDIMFLVARSPAGSTAGTGIAFRTAPAGGGETTRVFITSTGTVEVRTLGASGATQLCRNALNEIADCSSSIRYKRNIAGFDAGLSFINRLRPISFDWKMDGKQDIGFGAEDVAKIDPRFVTNNDKGEVEGVKYDRLVTVLVNAVKEQQAEIDSLKAKLDSLEKAINGRPVRSRKPVSQKRRRS